MQAEVIKLYLIQYIMEVADTYRLKKIDTVLRSIEKSESKINLELLATPMREYLDVKEFKKEQNYKPIDKKDFFKKIIKLKIEEPIEKLFEMI